MHLVTGLLEVAKFIWGLGLLRNRRLSLHRLGRGMRGNVMLILAGGSMLPWFRLLLLL